MKVKYITLEPSERKIRKAIASGTTSGLRKTPFLRFTFEDNSTSIYTVPDTDLQSDAEASLQIALSLYRNVLYRKRENLLYLKDFFPERFEIDLGTFATRYLETRERDVASGELAPKTFESYKYAFDILVEILGSSLRLVEIRPETIERFKRELLEKSMRYRKENYSRGAVNHFLRNLSAAFNYARKSGLLERNPFEDVRVLKTDAVPRWFDRETDSRLLDYLDGWKRDVYIFGTRTGARKSELFGANKSNLRGRKLEDGREGYSLEIINKGAVRTILVDDSEAVAVVKNRLERLEDPDRIRDELYGRNNSYPDRHIARAKNGFIFWECSATRSLSQFIARARRDLGLDERITFHSLRHSFAVWYLEERKGSIYRLQKLLGHRSVTTTERYLTCVPDYWE